MHESCNIICIYKRIINACMLCKWSYARSGFFVKRYRRVMWNINTAQMKTAKPNISNPSILFYESCSCLTDLLQESRFICVKND